MEGVLVEHRSTATVPMSSGDMAVSGSSVAEGGTYPNTITWFNALRR